MGPERAGEGSSTGGTRWSATRSEAGFELPT